MSALQYPEGLEAKDVQIWNNAAFDSAKFDEENECLESFSSKENRNPLLDTNSYGSEINSSVSSIKSSGPFMPIDSNGVLEKLKMNPIKADSKRGFGKKVVSKCFEVRDEEEIDKEIEEIEMEMSRLSSRLEALRIAKVEKSVKTVERRGRIVSAKFMEPKMEQNLSMSGKMKVQRRGLSVGPVEIMAGSRRGMSLGPSEIVSGVNSRKLTPIPPVQNRRKSCFFKLPDIDEGKPIKERGKNLSASPKTRKCIPENQVTRQAVTTIGSKKIGKKDDFVLNSVQPKRLLFKDGEKSVNATNKKPLRQGRTISSRYNQASAMRKRSLPDDDNDDGDRCDKKRSLSFGKGHVTQPEMINVGTESHQKKRWEIPNEIVVHGNFDDDDKSPQSVYVLPRIRIARCTEESPRDSGPAKRVADLVGRKSYFAIDEEVEPSVCQALSFIEE